MSLQKISSNIMFAVVSRALSGLVGLVVIGMASRYLGQSGFGEYNTIVSYLALFTILADFGLYSLLVREISKPGADEKFIASNIFTLRLGFVLGAALIAILISELFLPYDRTVKTGIIIASPFLVFSSLSQLVGGIYQKYLKFYVVSMTDVLNRIVQLVIVVLAVFFKKGLLLFALGVSLPSLVHFLIIFTNVKKIVPVRLTASLYFWKKIIKTAIPIMISLLFTAVYFRIDIFMLSIMKSPADVGIYGIAAKLLEVLIFLPALYASLIMPMLSRTAVADRHEFRELFRNTFSILLVLAIPTVVFLSVLAPSIVQIIGGKEFLISAGPLFILAFAVGLIFLGNLGGQSVVALDLQKYSMWIYMGGAFLNTGLNLLMIPRFSYNGAAFATLITEIFVTWFLFYLIKSKAKASPNLGITFKAILSGLIMAAAIYPFSNKFILIPGLIGIFVYFAFIYVFKVLSWKDLGDLIKEGKFSTTQVTEETIL